MRASKILTWDTVLVVVYLHHVDTGQILLHLLAVLDTLPVDHIVDVLNLIRADTCNIMLLGRRANAQNGLIDRR